MLLMTAHHENELHAAELYTRKWLTRVSFMLSARVRPNLATKPPPVPQLKTKTGA